MGRVAGIEAAAIGCNWSFAPIVDISYNWRNPIISNRRYLVQIQEKVLEMCKLYERYSRKWYCRHQNISLVMEWMKEISIFL